MKVTAREKRKDTGLLVEQGQELLLREYASVYFRL